MREHHLLTPRSARYLTLGPAADGARELWFALHGYGQLAARFARRLSPLDDGRRLIVVPEGLNRFYVDEPQGVVGAAWMTREDRLADIADYVRYLDALLEAVAPARRPPVHLLGFSQGSATACRWIERGAVRPQRLIIWGGEVPPDIDWAQAASRFRGLEIQLVGGDADPYATVNALAQHQAVLDSHGARARVIRYAGGHDIDREVLLEVAGSP